MAENINYGVSEAQLAGNAAEAYKQSTADTTAAYQAELNSIVADLGSKIQTGMSESEKAEYDARLADLQTRYKQSITNIRANYGFAQQQSQQQAAQTQRSLADIQTAQRALAAQTLGQVGYTGMPGTYSAQAADAALAAQRAAAANLALIGGEGAVPSAYQVATPPSPTGPGTELAFGPQQGLIGINKTTQDLFQSALLGAEARSVTETEQQQANIQSQYALDAARTTRERVAREQEQVQQFLLAGLQGLLNLKSTQANTLAQLEAAAAGADTRSGKQKAMAELDAYKRKADIDYQNQLKLVNARAKSSGASPTQIAAATAAANTAAGQATAFGKYANQRMANVANVFSGKTVLPKGYKLDRKTGVITDTTGTQWRLDSGVLTSTVRDSKGKQIVSTYPVASVLNDVTAFIGSLQGKKPEQQKQLWNNYYNTALNDPLLRRGLAIVLGPDATSANWYLTVGTSTQIKLPQADKLAVEGYIKSSETYAKNKGTPVKPYGTPPPPVTTVTKTPTKTSTKTTTKPSSKTPPKLGFVSSGKK